MLGLQMLPATQGGTKGLSDLHNHKPPLFTGSYPRAASPHRRLLRPGTTRTESQPTRPHAAPASSPFTASVSAPLFTRWENGPHSHLHLVSDKRFAL